MEKGNESRFKVIFVMGRPGSGKGTQCSRLAARFGIGHFSAGDLLRAERNNGTDRGEEIRQSMDNRKVVDVAITCQLVDEAMGKMKDTTSTFLLDGFPMNDDNFQGWSRLMSSKADVDLVILLDCPEEECAKRILNRGRTGSGGFDDKAESLRHRFDIYDQSTAPIVDHYRQKGILRRVEAHATPDEVFAAARTVFLEEGFTEAISESSKL